MLGGVVGTEGGTRTLTPFRALDFESSASTNSATSAFRPIGECKDTNYCGLFVKNAGNIQPVDPDEQAGEEDHAE